MRKLVYTFLASLCLSGIVRADSFTMTVTPSAAPNAFGSPSWTAYTNNAIFALEHGLSNFGGSTATDPTAYQATPIINPGDIEVTSAPSWDGQANPTGAFSGEFGTRLHFGLTIISTGATFETNNIGYAMESDDPADALEDDAANDSDPFLDGLTFNSHLVGVNYGADDAPGGTGADADTIYTSGSADGVALNALYYVGIGNALWPDQPGSEFVPGGTTQQNLDAATAYIDEFMHSVTTTYTVKLDDNTVHSADGTAVLVPVPASVLGGTVLMGILAVSGLCRRRSC
jgi:hypothetical protein